MSKKNTTTATVITFVINQSIAVLRTSPAGWTRELNVVTWNDNDPKFDIRDWNPDHTKYGKGLSFTAEELKALSDAVAELTKPATKKSSAKKAETKKAEPAKKAETKKAEPAKQAETKKAEPAEEQVDMGIDYEEPKTNKKSSKKAAR